MAESEECLQLTALHSLAVDFRKTGVPVILDICEEKHPELIPWTFPDFMQNKQRPYYMSDKALGKIFRKSRQSKNARIFLQNFVANFVNKAPEKRRIAAIQAQQQTLPKHLQPKFGELIRLMQEDPKHFDQLYQPVLNIFDGYRKEMLSIQKRFEVRTELELFMNRVLHYFSIPGMREYEIRQRIEAQVNVVKTKFRGLFFREFYLKQKITEDSKEEENKDQELSDFEIVQHFSPGGFDITDKMVTKALLWYLVSLDRLCKDDKVALGFPFIVFDVLCPLPTKYKINK
ncbi:hypothetical protein RFI_12665 [Reticulomyxa filosa]|uniref:RNA-dependent RNA polymerase n=1 Tax=Reticulomyxa filosa TaxID=46433 RepID=X6NDU7_RETFI|nr:hypothetical protein RFI_12665 [Reticulomyxa filosa]|eukprot:ETO24495.1 hypothetical protein RFI_12665 [Reticulomyxa filosa]